jgi:hypothetical protein
MKKVIKLSPYQLQQRTIEQEMIAKEVDRKRKVMIADIVNILVIIALSNIIMGFKLLTDYDKGTLVGLLTISLAASGYVRGKYES